MLLDHYEFDDIHIKQDPATGMLAIIAVHNTTLGPALGGCRFIEYHSYSAALDDALRLAKGMSYKAAALNLPLGGGKAVIVKPSQPFDRKGYFAAFGQFVQTLNGRYITALDSGTELADMDQAAEFTPYVASRSCDGDPAPSTAEGVFLGIQAAVLFQRNQDSLHNIHVAIQGLGHVGYALAQHLHQAGARLSVADTNPHRVQQAVRELNATAIDTDRIHQIPCDVFSPCALGGILNTESIPQLQCRIIAGAANNQLTQDTLGQRLQDNDILYAPDFIINAGGLIHAAGQYLRQTEHIKSRLLHIHTALLDIFSDSVRQHQATNYIANLRAREQLA
jgi:leucine dehydrogenase